MEDVFFMISHKIAKNMANGSWIRKMFEEGSRLKAQYGADKVFDFSLGNPDLEPPEKVLEAIRRQAADPRLGLHGYMSNVGYLETRTAIADQLSASSGLAIEPAGICMTVGAAGALNVALKALLDPGDEVLILAPFFVEYISYIDNHGGVAVAVDSDPETLLPDMAAIARAITPRTKAMIINSPNNPSGVVYSAETLQDLNAVLNRAGHTIYVLSDEPYADLTYDGQSVPSSLACIEQLILCYSWSKSLSLPGERIGYVCISPRCAFYQDLVNAIAFCNRILGFVNAPAFFQRVIQTALDAKVDVARYERRRDRIYEILTAAGFTVRKPAGGLYFFPRCPIADDTAFAQACARHNVLIVPGRGFGYPGFFRLCFAVSEATIENSAAAWLAIGREFGLIG
jgi:aspartate aminotransferase